MYQRLLMAILFGFLAFGTASGQESNVQPESRLQLKGVLISGSGHTALVSGRSVREGDRIDGAEILAIEQRRIRVRVGADEFSVRVGGSFAVERSINDVALAASSPARESRDQQQLAKTRHAVKAGETLSGIALRYLKDGITMDQMMIALFRSNPQAFSNNINVLHEGATLGIPGAIEARRYAPATAAAEVARHAERWQHANHQPVSVAVSSPAPQYGPVEAGATLSEIAVRVRYDGVALNQMMIALYDANPHAFGNNINVLREEAILNIPAETEVRRQAPETATAEVVRQTKIWHTGLGQHALSTPPQPDIVALVHNRN